MEEDLRAVEDEPADGEPDDDRDVDGLAKASAGAFVVDLVEEVNELVELEMGEAPGVAAAGPCGAAVVWAAGPGWEMPGLGRSRR